MKNFELIAQEIRAIIDNGDPWVRLNEMADAYQARRSLAMQAMQRARYLAQHVFTSDKHAFLLACGVRP